MGKSLFAVVALLFAFIASGLAILKDGGEDSPLAFNPNDEKWAKYSNVEFSFEKLLTLLRKGESIPEVAQLTRALEELHSVYLTMNTSKILLDPDTFRTIPEIVRDKGYPAEEHLVTTTDGYKLEIFRIPNGVNTTRGGPPVLLSHGLIDTAGSWVLNYPKESLPYLLADLGYDVWLGNIRGNRYGDGHIEFGDLDKKLWDFSFDEQGRYDVPQTLDYIRGITKRDKVAVIGHSQGGTQFFASFYQTPAIADKVNFFAGLAPAIYFTHNVNAIIHFAAHLYLGELLELVGIDKFIRLPDSLIRGLAYVCQAAPATTEFILGLIMGYNPGELNKERMSVMCYHALGMTSVQNMVHWAQMVRTAEYKAHDFGWFENQRVYGQRSPPLYEIPKIVPKNLPIAVFFGEKDLLVSAKDSLDFVADLPAGAVFVKNIPQYSHMDFLHGQTANKNVYEDLIRLLQVYVPV